MRRTSLPPELKDSLELFIPGAISGTTILDVSGSGNDWTLVWTPTFQRMYGSKWVVFNGSSQRIDFADIFDINIETNISFSFILKSGTTGGDDDIISNYGQAVGGWWSIDWRADDKIHFTTWNSIGGNSGEAVSTNALTSGKTYAISCVKAWTTANVYVDLLKSSNWTLVPITPAGAGRFTVGGEPRIYGYKDCTIENLMVHTKTLSPYLVQLYRTAYYHP